MGIKKNSLRYLACAAAAALCLTGCGAEQPVPESVTIESAAQIQTETAAAQSWDYFPVVVNVTPGKMEGFDEETGEVLTLTMGYDQAQVLTPAKPEVGRKITDFLAEKLKTYLEGDPSQEERISGFDALLEFSREVYEQAGLDMLPCSSQRQVKLLRGDAGIVNLILEDDVYLGGPHGSSYTESIAFDSSTGELLHLEDLSPDPEAFRQLLVQKMLQITEEEPEISDRIDFYEPSQYEQAFSKLLRDGTWTLTDEFFSITSAEYELGSYAAGPIGFYIPAEELQGLIYDRYLPAQRVPGKLVLTEKPDPEKPLIGSVTLGEAPAELYLEAQGTVTDVAVNPVVYRDDWFFRESACLLCGQLRDSRISLQTTVPEMIPDLMVSWRDGEGAYHHGLLTMSGKDGTFFLNEDFNLAN